jgi:hypothetical protein
MNRISRLMLACLPALWVSCGRETNAPPATAASATAPASPRGPLPISKAPVSATVIPDSGDPNATLQQMTLALRDYVVRTRSVPKSFEDFAAKSQARFPLPPAGKKYAIQGQEVVLVKR